MKKKKNLINHHNELDKNVEEIAHLLPKDLITLEAGEDILHLFHEKKHRSFSRRSMGIRKHILSEKGFIKPFIKFSAGKSCRPNNYLMKIKNVYVAGGEVFPDKLLLIVPPHIIDSFHL